MFRSVVRRLTLGSPLALGRRLAVGSHFAIVVGTIALCAASPSATSAQQITIYNENGNYGPAYYGASNSEPVSPSNYGPSNYGTGYRQAGYGPGGYGPIYAATYAPGLQRLCVALSELGYTP